MSLILSPFSRYIFELRLGRMNNVLDFLDKNPGALNSKMQTSPTAHESFLELATRFDQTNNVLLLKNRGAVETPTSAPGLLARAVTNQNDRLVELFTQWGWDPWGACGDLQAPMPTAVCLGYTFALNLWDKAGVPFTHLNDDGENLLHILMKQFAIWDASEQMRSTAVMLMKKGNAWDLKNAHGETPATLCNPKEQAKLTQEWEKICAKRSKTAILNAIPQDVEEKGGKKRKL